MMPKATFTKDFVWKAKRNVRISYRAGKTYGITTACMSAARTAGALGDVSVGLKASPGADGSMRHEVDDAG